jgi:cytidine deaminase
MANLDIDWETLRSTARRMASSAYAPYSKLSVGAAALVDDGRIVAGCNVENASYGLTLCAECGLVSNLHSSGGGRLVAVTVVAGDGNQLTPCGRCRQLLLEHGGPECALDAPGGITTIGAILPGAFNTRELEGRRRPT